MIQAIVFDFDGTLVDSNRIKYEAMITIARQRKGGEQLIRNLLDHIKGDRYIILAAFESFYRNSQVSPEDESVKLLAKAYSDLVDTAVISTPEKPGAYALLSSLKRDYRLILSSATPRENLYRILAKRGWTDFFYHVAGSPTSKTETLINVMDDLNLSNNEIIVVGDGEDDLASATSIGCKFFPVGEARGINSSQKVYTLPELQLIFSHS